MKRTYFSKPKIMNECLKDTNLIFVTLKILQNKVNEIR
eukprot:UN15421